MGQRPFPTHHHQIEPILEIGSIFDAVPTPSHIVKANGKQETAVWRQIWSRLASGAWLGEDARPQQPAEDLAAAGGQLTYSPQENAQASLRIINTT